MWKKIGIPKERHRKKEEKRYEKRYKIKRTKKIHEKTSLHEFFSVIIWPDYQLHTKMVRLQYEKVFQADDTISCA